MTAKVITMQTSTEQEQLNTQTPADTLLDGTNRLYHAKLTGALESHEFANNEILVGDIYANGLQQNKVAEGPETFKSFIPTKNIFKFPHEGLEEAAKTVKQAIDVAIVNAKFLDNAEEEKGKKGLGKSKVLTMDMDEAA